MKILITGAAGAIGSHVAEAFALKGHDVWGMDNLNDYYDVRIKRLNLDDVKKAGASVLIADLHTVSYGSCDYDVIIHFAAQPGISSNTDFDSYQRNNIDATKKLLDFAKTASNLKLFLHISTSSVYGKSACGSEEEPPEPTSIYGVTKLCAEQLALSKFRSEGLPVAVFRLFSVYGPRERPEKLYHKLIMAMLRDQPFPLHEGSGAHTRSFTYVSDVVNACLLAIHKPSRIVGEIINIGGGEVRSTQQGIDIIEEIMGKKAIIEIIPPRSGDQLETEAVVDKANWFLGYKPEILLMTGLLKQVEWQKRLLAVLDK